MVFESRGRSTRRDKIQSCEAQQMLKRPSSGAAAPPFAPRARTTCAQNCLAHVNGKTGWPSAACDANVSNISLACSKSMHPKKQQSHQSAHQSGMIIPPTDLVPLGFGQSALHGGVICLERIDASRFVHRKQPCTRGSPEPSAQSIDA